MVIDNITLEDLNIINREEQYSLFGKLNFCNTLGGIECLRNMLLNPFSDIDKILAMQDTLQYLVRHQQYWPTTINNGAITVIEKFYASSIDTPPHAPNAMNLFFYKILHKHDYSLIRFSAQQQALFIQGLKQFVLSCTKAEQPPALLKVYFDSVLVITNNEQLTDILPSFEDEKKLPSSVLLSLGGYCLSRFKHQMMKLLDIYYQLEAYHSLATAIRKYALQFPTFDVDKEYAYIQSEGLYHLLLPTPVSYEITMSKENNFIFLTGANMAGKSTLIRSIGCAVYLAHLGMAVPAKHFAISLFDGLLTNINVSDNIAKGESYFYNEVQRIKNTVDKINNGKKWLVLIDELFKGTNVQDAMRCSLAVIKGLIKIRRNAFVLSTHLYEIGEELTQYPNISFKYFETNVANNILTFSYQLKDGISNDRLGYFILQREGVVDLLEKL